MKVVFAHGKESGPWGTKIRALAALARAAACTVESIDFRHTADPERRVQHLLETVGQTEEPVILVGSSMGGYVATVAAQTLRPCGLFLMAPAFYLPGYHQQNPAPGGAHTVIVHGLDDDVVPLENVLCFARRHRAALHLLPAGHTLVEQLPAIKRLFAAFLQDVAGSLR
jgi:pimeloyl-ACP methyl ester carboxylesterase